MFWTLLRRLLAAGRGRLALALLALTGGAAVVFALLNLQSDAERKMTQEFRRFGANVMVTPARARESRDLDPPLMSERVMDAVAAARPDRGLVAAPFLYVVAGVADRRVVVAGTWPDALRSMTSWWRIEGAWITDRDDRRRCLVGRNVARLAGLHPGSLLVLRRADRQVRLEVAGIVEAGGGEDSQVFVALPVAQELAGTPGQIGLVQVSVPGSAREVASATGLLAERLAGLEVRPLRQIAEAEGRILGRIRLLILAMVSLILGLTILSLIAITASVALQRRRDVGLMMALGGSAPRVVRLFLTEVTLLGAAGGLLGCAAGAALSAWVGRSVFGAGIAPRPEILLLTLALMMTAALAGALPLRLLGRVRPAEILRGE